MGSSPIRPTMPVAELVEAPSTTFLAFLGLIFGIIGLFLKGRRRGAAITGIIISFVALVLSIILAIVYTAGFATAVNKTVEDSNADAAKTLTLVYEVTGDSSDSLITYSTYNASTSGSEQATSSALPFSKSITVKKGGTSDFNSYSVIASNGSTGATITCKITLDGTVLSTQTATGFHASASCSGTGK